MMTQLRQVGDEMSVFVSRRQDPRRARVRAAKGVNRTDDVQEDAAG
jgi:hypothetical protein